MASTPSTARIEFFQQLKQCCVPIIKLSTGAGDKSASAKPLLDLLVKLYGMLDGQINQNASIFDDKLADYVFLPLVYVFRSLDQYPLRVIETAVKCIRIMIQNGWKSKVPGEVVQQLLVLLTFIIGGVPGQDTKREVPEETKSEAYRALNALVHAAGSSPSGAAALVEAKTMPALGHTMSVALEDAAEGETPTIQLAALDTIQGLYTAIKDQEALASFLPGTTSSLTRLLSPPTSLKRRKKVLIRGLQALRVILTKVLGDIKTRGIIKQQKDGTADTSEGGKVLTSPWLGATASQVKLALSSVMKLRSHEAEEVQSALERLCIALLDECHYSLAPCTSILVETAMMLAPVESEKSLQDTSLQDLATLYPELSDTVKSIMYNWVTSLSRIMQSSGESVKQRAFRNLLKGNELVAALQIDSSTLDDTLATALRDSIATLLMRSIPPKVMNEVDVNESLGKGSDLMKSASQLQSFSPVLLSQEGQKRTREEVATLMSQFGSSTQKVKLAAELLGYVRDSDGMPQLSSYWLSFELLKAAFSQSSALDNFLDFSSITKTSEDQEAIFQELYTYSVSFLAAHSDLSGIDWRLEAIALEVAAFAASRMQIAFRPELIDVLYPISTFLGSHNHQLRGHAIVALNSIAASCGYSSVSELVVDNADYMVNSISLRLNTFDISPASSKVLTMMIRLSGPRLVPYLDDVVASIFSALDNYHGYPVLVESLFTVLGEIVEQGVKSDALLLESSNVKAVDHKKKPVDDALGMGEILELLEKRLEREKRTQEEEASEGIEEIKGHPKIPWKAKEEGDADELQDEGTGGSGAEVDNTAIPKTPTYNLLTRVTILTQHYLTSPTPRLRKSLLELLVIVCPALAPDENAFLPLVNEIWPVAVGRLYDPESFVAISACGAISALCETAGDFLSSRIKTEWWDRLGKWCRKTKEQAANKTVRFTAARHTKGRDKVSNVAGHGGGKAEGILIPIRSATGEESTQLVQSTGSGGGLGQFASAAQIWEATIGLLTAVISHVRVDDDIFDQILDLLVDVLATHGDTRRALEVVNADAVWLAFYQRGRVGWKPAPKMEGVEFVPMERFGA